MYVSTVEKLLKDVLYNPGVWISISLMFLLCSLPIITIGVAWGLAAYYARAHITGDKIRCFPMLKCYCKSFFFPSFMMGVLDLLFFLAALFSLTVILDYKTPGFEKLFYTLFFGGNCIYLLSGIYRYPLMVNNRLPFPDILVKGILFTVGWPGNTVLIFMLFLFILLMSFLTGLGIFVFFPAASALLFSYHYKSVISQKMIRKNLMSAAKREYQSQQLDFTDQRREEGSCFRATRDQTEY